MQTEDILVVDEAGAFAITRKGEQTPYMWGAVHENAGEVIFVNDVANGLCRDIEGAYAVGFAGNELHLTRNYDDCEERAELFGVPWNRKG